MIIAYILNTKKIDSSYSPKALLTTRYKHAFHKAAALITRHNLQYDAEGVVAQAFMLFRPVYPNMLSSSKVIEEYYKSLPQRLRYLHNSCRHHVIAAITATNDFLRLYEDINGIQSFLSKNTHPIIAIWFGKLLGLNAWNTTETHYRALFEFKLWPYGYIKSKHWREILREIGIIGGSYVGIDAH